MLQRVILTGANGFVGRYVANALPCLPMVDNQGRIDIRDASRVDAFVDKVRPDAVIHLASQSFVPESFKNPQETFDINFYGTFNLLSALKNSGFKGRMLFVGSGDMYGLVSPEQLPVSEELPPKPRNPYAVSKVAAEALCYQWSQTEGFEIVLARPFNHIGPGQSPQFAISDFARQIINIKLGRSEPVLNVGDIDVTRDFTDVRDVVSAYIKILEKGSNGSVYNVCSGVERNLRDIIQSLAEYAGVEIEIRQDESRLRPSEQRRIRGNCQRLMNDTGWNPEISLEKSLTDLLEYWERESQ